MIRSAAVLGVLAVLAFAGWKTYGAGYSAAVADAEAARMAVQRDLDEAGQKLRLKQRQTADALSDLRNRAQEAEYVARQNFDTCRLPSDDSLRRLKERWGAP